MNTLVILGLLAIIAIGVTFFGILYHSDSEYTKRD